MFGLRLRLAWGAVLVGGSTTAFFVMSMSGLSDPSRCTVTALVRSWFCMVPHFTVLHQRCLFNSAHRRFNVHTTTVSPVEADDCSFVPDRRPREAP